MFHTYLRMFAHDGKPVLLLFLFYDTCIRSCFQKLRSYTYQPASVEHMSKQMHHIFFTQNKMLYIFDYICGTYVATNASDLLFQR